MKMGIQIIELSAKVKGERENEERRERREEMRERDRQTDKMRQEEGV